MTLKSKVNRAGCSAVDFIRSREYDRIVRQYAGEGRVVGTPGEGDRVNIEARPESLAKREFVFPKTLFSRSTSLIGEAVMALKLECTTGEFRSKRNPPATQSEFKKFHPAAGPRLHPAFSRAG
jgi:hypothetical protein